MKKLVSIFAVFVMTLGMFSCQPENSVDETDALYENASDGEQNTSDIREGI